MPQADFSSNKVIAYKISKTAPCTAHHSHIFKMVRKECRSPTNGKRISLDRAI